MGGLDALRVVAMVMVWKEGRTAASGRGITQPVRLPTPLVRLLLGNSAAMG
jgi:hypothetical protein